MVLLKRASIDQVPLKTEEKKEIHDLKMKLQELTKQHVTTLDEPSVGENRHNEELMMSSLSGCFGCCSKSTPVIAVDEPSKGLRIQGRAVTKSSLSDEFWSTTTCDLDIAAIQSQKSISSISGGGSTNIQQYFVNPGLHQWNQSRLQWVDHKKSENSAKAQEYILRNTTYESLLGTAENFPHSIPLPEMVGFLVNIWEHEGLYE
ncbi:hypothetical protein L1987_64700 [Smallanthus sonchifolius]|uniref:Uncharacterized protein n=1 Tax=Smallanthus sonchifolius TaxID=185202 RepID=A0ACB9BSH1_9ASTR|nr:hypothetical protein L1987_64700 [Smallanthus sonchifolius]